MNKAFIAIISILFASGSLSGQEVYTIQKALFSSEKYDEFSPVYYGKGIVYCSNQKSSSVLNYTTPSNKGLFKIIYADTTKSQMLKPELFSENLSSKLNDGPVTFNSHGDTVYFSRNLFVDGAINTVSSRNKLGIFYAVYDGNDWSEAKELRFNSDSYNITTPFLSPDGKRLYFASDKPEGFGGSDLYYCQWTQGYWGNPVNLGPVINTSGNEAFPFINEKGELFFSSDSLPGLGKKDIFFSKLVSNEWIEPVNLKPPVNSSADDFGFICDAALSKGYFSSDRDNSVDIYKFRSNKPQLLYCEEQKTNQYCFSFPDDIMIDIDPLNMQFQWDFGDGSKVTGYVVEHCFKGPGNYLVKQDIIDKKTGRLIFNKHSFDLVIKDMEQPFITSDTFVKTGTSITIDGSRSNLPGSDNLSYFWDFGDGTVSEGSSVTHTYIKEGDYHLKLGVISNEKNTGKKKQECVSKLVFVRNNLQQDTAKKGTTIGNSFPMIQNHEQVSTNVRYSSSVELSEKAIFQVEVFSSKTKVNTSMFSVLEPKYNVREYFNNDSKLYSYVIDEGIVFADLYLSLKDAFNLNFRNARIITFIPENMAEKELWDLKRKYGISSDIYFTGTNFRIQEAAYPLLDELAALMKRYPEFVLEIAAHTDNTLPPAANMTLSRNRAQSIVSYLVNKGVSKSRFIYAGYGDTRPVASNYSEADRRKNRRIDFFNAENK